MKNKVKISSNNSAETEHKKMMKTLEKVKKWLKELKRKKVKEEND